MNGGEGKIKETNMKTKHTDGQWIRGGNSFKKVTCNGKLIATVAGVRDNGFRTVRAMEEESANTNLIIGAPKLLDACISTLQSLDQMVLDSTMRGFYIVLKDAVKAAGVDFDTLSE